MNKTLYNSCILNVVFFFFFFTNKQRIDKTKKEKLWLKYQQQKRQARTVTTTSAPHIDWLNLIFASFMKTSAAGPPSECGELCSFFAFYGIRNIINIMLSTICIWARRISQRGKQMQLAILLLLLLLLASLDKINVLIYFVKLSH